MSDLPVPVDKPKKERIAELSDQGVSPQEIARLLGTSLGNVYKETAIYRKSRGKTTYTKSRKTAVSFDPEKNDGRGKISRTDEVKLEVEHDGDDLISAPPLDEERVKDVFSALQSHKKPIDILAENGYNPEAVEKQYWRFLRLTGQDHAALVSRIVKDIIKVQSEMVDSIKSSYTKKGYLDNDNLMLLLSMEVSDRFQSGQNDILSSISDASRAPPDGFDRPRCRICNAPIAGALFLKNSPAARTMWNANLFCPRHST
jgi:hypothetical protein